MQSITLRIILRVLIMLSLASAALAQTKTYTAAESIKEGDLVLLDTSGKIRRADFSGYGTDQKGIVDYPRALPWAKLPAAPSGLYDEVILSGRGCG